MKPTFVSSFCVIRAFRVLFLRECTTLLLFAGLLLQSATAAAPGWWTTQGVLNPQKPADDYAALNLGQLKLLSSRAWLQMELSLPGGAGPELTQLISGWKLIQPQTDDFAVANVGQLKRVVRPFYERLADAGLLTLPAWISQAGTSTSDDFAAANLGQAKTLFNFVIPQALGNLPQRLSGNGMTGLNGVVPPSGYEWGSGHPPYSPDEQPAVPAVLPGSEDEVSTTPTSTADLDAMQTSQLVIEYNGAGGSVGKSVKYVEDNDGNYVRDGWDWGGSAYDYSYQNSETDITSKDALESALTSLSDLKSDFSDNYSITQSWNSSPTYFNLGSYYTQSLAPEGDADEGEEVMAFWSGEQLQIQAYYEGGPSGGASRDAWWHVTREISNDDGLVRREVEFQPYTIASSRGAATTTSVTSQCWDTPGEYEMTYVNLVLPEVLQVNDGDADGDGIPDFADGQKTAYPAPEDEPDTPQTTALVNIDYLWGDQAKVCFHYSASDPSSVTSTENTDGTATYTPASGSLRLWRTQIFEDYRMNRNPQTVAAGGDFIPPDVWLEASSLGYVHCESVALSQAQHDQTVTVEIDPDGDGPEDSYIWDKHFFTSLGLQLEKVVDGVIGQRDMRLEPSLPNPTIDLQTVNITNARTSEDGSSLLVDIDFSGTVHSTVCDLTAGTETGTIQNAYASVNDEPNAQSLVTLQVTKTETPDGQDRPYPYEGAFTHTMTGVSVTEGQNTLGIIVSDPLYHLSGTAEVAFEIEATPPAALGDGSGTAVTLELPMAGSTLAADELRLNVEVDDEPLLGDVVLKQQAGGLLYRSADGRAAFQFVQPPVLSAVAPDALHGYVTLPEPGWQSALFSPLVESGDDTGEFSWSAEEIYGDYWGWSVSVALVADPVLSAGGEFNPYTVRMEGPAELLAQVRQMHLGGRALPVVVQNGVYRVADPEHPERPITLASLPMNAVKPPEVPQDQSISQELAALGIGWTWDELDVPEEEHDAMEEAMSRRLSQNASAETGLSFTDRIKRQAKTALRDGITPSFYGGFVVGFVDNPWSNAKDGCSTLIGIGKKAAEVAWLASPLGMVWEFTFGDSYQGEIQAAKQMAKKTYAAVSGAYHFAKKWGEPVCGFLEKLINQSANEVSMALRGEFPSRADMGPELQMAVDVITQLIILADDAWADMDPYDRGYWLGYITFEVAAVVVAAVLTAPAGGAGGTAVLARHGPKLTRIMGYLEKLLSKFDDVPGIKKMVDKIGDFVGVGKKMMRYCFVAGTTVLTVHGLVPIEQLKEGEWVWSRSEDGAKWAWRPIVRTFTTHPIELVEVSYEARANKSETPSLCLPQDMLSKLELILDDHQPNEAKLVCTPGHPFHVWRSDDKAEFVDAGKLKPGDVLTLANGASAEVQSITSRISSLTSPFTTYNFSVADHHTYFAGTLPVWVHNENAKIAPCDMIWSHFEQAAKEFGGLDNINGKTRLQALARAKELIAKDKNLIDKVDGNITSSHWVKTGREECEKMFQELADTPGDLPSFTEWKAFFKRNPKGQDGHDVHHLIEKWIQKELGITGNLDDVPGMVLPRSGPNGHAQLAGKLKSAVNAARKKGASGLQRQKDIKDAIRDVYLQNSEWAKMWPAAEKWLFNQVGV